MPSPIYLDHNATAPILPEVADAVREASLRYTGNPASQHAQGREARRALETARESIGQLLGARTAGMEADRVIFTSGGTESNNLALTGLLQPRALPGGRGPSGAAHDPRDAAKNPWPEAGAEDAARLIISPLE